MASIATLALNPPLMLELNSQEGEIGYELGREVKARQ